MQIQNGEDKDGKEEGKKNENKNQVELKKKKKDEYKLLKVSLLSLNACMGSLTLGYMLSVYNPLFSQMQSVLNMNPSQVSLLQGIITSVIPLGNSVGALLCVKYSHSSKITSMKIADLLIIPAAILSIISNIYCVIIGRFFIGVASGINSFVIPIYISQISPAAVAGFTGSFFQTFICIGIQIAFILGLNTNADQNVFINQHWWRLMFLFPIIFASIRLLILTFIFKFDTPQQYISQSEFEQAKLALALVYNPQYVDAQFQLLIYQQPQTNVDNFNYQTDQQDENIQLNQNSKKKIQQEDEVDPQKISFLQFITSKKYRFRLFLGLTLSICQQFTGINAITFYSTQIIQGNNPTQEQIKLSQIVTALIGLDLIISSIIGGKLVDIWGKKIVLLIGQIIMSVSLLVLGFSQERTVGIVFIMIFVFFFCLSLGPITWIYIAEILPPIGCTLTTIVNWFSAFIVGISFPTMTANISIQGAFFLFAGFTIYGALVVLFFLKETKGMNSAQIQQIFETQVELSNNKQLINTKQINNLELIQSQQQSQTVQ